MIDGFGASSIEIITLNMPMYYQVFTVSPIILNAHRYYADKYSLVMYVLKWNRDFTLELQETFETKQNASSNSHTIVMANWLKQIKLISTLCAFVTKLYVLDCKWAMCNFISVGLTFAVATPWIETRLEIGPCQRQWSLLLKPPLM